MPQPISFRMHPVSFMPGLKLALAGLAAILALSACGRSGSDRTAAPPATAPSAAALSAADLARQVRQFAYRQNPNLLPDAQFKVEQFDVPGLWEAARTRLLDVHYLDKDGQQFNSALLAWRDGKLTPFANAQGGEGLLSAVLLGDQLYYTHSWGSGRHRSQVARLTVEDGQIRIIASEEYPNVDLFVSNIRGRIQVEAGDYAGFNAWSWSRPVGSVKVVGSSLAIVDDKDAPVPPTSTLLKPVKR